MISTNSLIIIFDELLSDLNNKSDGFSDYIDDDLTPELLAHQCNEQLNALMEVKQELNSRGISTDEYNIDFNFNQQASYYE